MKVTFHGSSSGTMAQEQNKFLKLSLINIYSLVDKSVACVVGTDAVIDCLSVNDANLLTVFLVNSQLLHWISSLPNAMKINYKVILHIF